MVRGDVAIRGTFKEPVLSGGANLSLGTVRVVQPGIVLTDGVATLSFKDRQVTIDSLIALSGGGPIRVSGTMDITKLTSPRSLPQM